MKIKSLTARNFMALGEVDLENIDKMGLVLLQGKNMDDPSASSNGAGKSSLVDAISWCLWGETARGESGDSVVNDKAGKDCMVALDLEDGGDHYRITRYRKHAAGKSGLRVYQLSGGIAKDLTQGTTELTQAVVERVMGCKSDVFNAAIYAGQEKMPDLPSMTDKELKVIVEQAAGIDRLQAAHEVARQRRSDAAGAFELARMGVENLARQLGDDKTLLDQNEEKRKAWNVERAKRVAELELISEKADADVNNACIDARKAESEIDGYKAELTSIRAKIDGAAGERIQQTALRKAAQDLDREFQRAKATAGVALAAVERAKTDKTHVHDRLGKPCRECARPYEEKDLVGADEAATKRIEEHTKDARDKAIYARDVQSKLLAAQKELADFEASMTDVSAEITRERALNAQIATAQRVIDAVAVALRALETARQAEDRERSQINPFISVITDLQKRLDARNTQLEAAKVKMAEAEKALDLAEKAVKVFGPLGVRGAILDTVTPYLNDRTAHYLGILSDGNISATWTTLSKTAKGDVREKFCIEVTNTKGGKKFGLLSGGEKRKVRLAAAMALQDLVAARATKPLNIFIADEIDHALDAAGLERLMGILEEKAREKGSVLVVSHNSLRDWIRNVITVIKEGGVSRVECEVS